MVGPTKGKCAVACVNCRIKKAKCNGTKPCKTCQEQRLECSFPPPPQRSAPRRSRAKELERRFSCLEATIYGSQLDGKAIGAGAGLADMSPKNTPSVHQQQRPVNEHRGSLSSPWQQDSGSYLQFHHRDSSNILPAPVSIQHPPSDCSSSSDKVTSTQPGPAAAMLAPLSPPNTEASATSCSDASINPITVPNAFFSICSEPAAKWVSRHIGVPDFTSVARRLTAEVMGNDKQQLVKPERAPEPELDTAMAWTAVFFERSWISRFSLVERKPFERRLREGFQTRDLGPHTDSTWYALRNTIYAIGYRVAIAESGRSFAFREASARSWPYFENALSVHTEMVYAKSGLAEIQTLALMAYFAEGLGNMGLEYMLISNAVRLAQAQGMHLNRTDLPVVPPEDAGKRDSLWWLLYAYDKHLACRSGRPSAIDDDDMSCAPRIPGALGPLRGQTRDEFFDISYQHSLISSQILKRCCTVRALRQPPADLLAVVKDLDAQLRAWHDSLPPVYQCNPPYVPTRLPPGTHQNAIIFASCVYNSDLILMHRLFTYPWNGVSQDSLMDAQRPVSTAIVADAARNILMAIQGITITVAMPVWLAIYFPLVGLINLFLHVVQNPLLPTTNSDIALMDVVVGHFGYLEFASGSELGTQFPRKVVAYAREVIARAGPTSDGSHLVHSFLEQEDLAISDHRTQQDQQDQQEMQIPVSAVHDIFGPGLAALCPDYLISDDIPSDLHDFLVQAWPSFLPS